MNLDDILSIQPNCICDLFVFYDVSVGDRSQKQLQMRISDIKIDTDILHDKRFAINFETNNSKNDN